MDRKAGLFIVLLTGVYFVGWIAYYLGTANALVIMDLCVAPCIAFMIFSML